MRTDGRPQRWDKGEINGSEWHKGRLRRLAN